MSSKLSSFEIEILWQLSEGKPTKVVALDRGVSYFTLKNQIDAIYRKLDVQTRLEALLKAHILVPGYR